MKRRAVGHSRVGQVERLVRGMAVSRLGEPDGLRSERSDRTGVRGSRVEAAGRGRDALYTCQAGHQLRALAKVRPRRPWTPTLHGALEAELRY
jgi:hypothetical protein